ncbi:MAG: type II toxin-antitoxin system Phd/YefM family antitoxin [Phycisphaerales bacterium]|nr:type II toxin-antitoxin system Phd/YefM family antitoxin [Phycisphaerales bacterium]
MIRPDDIMPLSDFQRHARERIAALKSSGRPVVLTVNGRAEVVVQDAGAYQRLLDALDRLETLEAIREGIAQIESGEGIPLEQFDAWMRERHGIQSPGDATGTG